MREVLKAKRLTYADVAKMIGVSEVTIKRVFSTQNCSLQMIFELCDILEISFFDLSALANQDQEVDYVLTPEQENFFAKHPAYFGILKALHLGTSTAALAKQWQLNSQKLFRVLRRLEKLDLLEVLPKNEVRLKVIGNIRFQHQGPLAKKILRPQINQFLDHVDVVLKNKDVCMHSAEVELSKAHISELVEEIHALGAKYRAKATRDKSLLSSDKIESVRWLYAFAPYQTNWRQYDLGELD